MRSTLFHVPTTLMLGDWRVPLFGAGLLLLAWGVLAGVALWRAARKQGFAAALAGLGPGLLVLGILIGLVPRLDDGAGIPVRGFGVMLLCAAAAGLWLSVRRGRAAGFDADTIVGLGFWIFVAGLVGARLFYVIEYHDDFFTPDVSLWRSLAAMLNIAAGGLVVFGALPTAALAAWGYARRHRLDLLRLADVIAPGLLVGLAIGRVGCFLNGCCYGGPTDLPWGVSFPVGSPPAACFPDAAAGGASVPLHPAQLYAAVDAAILSLVAVAVTPLFHRAGEVFALVLTLHPLSRILLEVIRVDEPPALGTPLSISQLVSLVLLGLAACLWWWIARQPPPASGVSRRGALTNRPTAGQIDAMAEPVPDQAAANPADAKVEEEWQRLERRRLEEERAEAREDAQLVTGEPLSRRRILWTWLAIALVAGVIAAAVINRLLMSAPGPAP